MRNLDWAQFLKDAKTRLNIRGLSYGNINYKFNFICHSISMGYPTTQTWEVFERQNALKNEIHRRLNAPSVEYYLSSKGLVRSPYPEHLSKKTKDKVQSFRHAWVDELIKEFENA